MTIKLIIYFFFISNLCFGQKGPLGLYGKCDDKFSGYVCQQILFKEDKTFVFYDLLHLRGWKISSGIWKLNGDTVILATATKYYSFNYKGTSSADSLSILFTDNFDPLSNIEVSLGSKSYFTSSGGVLKYPRMLIDTIEVSFFSKEFESILIEKEKIRNIDTLVINLEMDVDGIHFFKNEKWLLLGTRLFHSRDSTGYFEKERYFDKAKLTELKYHEN